LRGIRYAKDNKAEAIRSIMKWSEMDQQLAEGSYDMAVSGWSNTGAASPQGVQTAMEEIRGEFKLETAPDPARAFDWSFVQR
jgi:ABC-type nitrate/sulfonate/bicarbonate transport system substrate-binding protein